MPFGDVMITLFAFGVIGVLPRSKVLRFRIHSRTSYSARIYDDRNLSVWQSNQNSQAKKDRTEKRTLVLGVYASAVDTS